MSQFKQNEYMIWRPGEFLIELNTLVPNYAEVLRAYKKHKKQGNRGYVLNQEWDHVYQPALVNLMQSLCHIFWAGQGLLLQHKSLSAVGSSGFCSQKKAEWCGWYFNDTSRRWRGHSVTLSLYFKPFCLKCGEQQSYRIKFAQSSPETPISSLLLTPTL